VMVLYAVCRGIVEGFCRLYWRLRVEGRENLPTDRPFILAPVHRSNIDTLIAGSLTRRRLRFMGKDSMWKYRPTGWLFSALGAFPVHRGTADRDALRKCIEVLEAGEPLVVFPEGTRQFGPEVQPLFEGAAYISAKTGAPIVPVGIGGSEAAMPKGSKFVKPVKVVAVIGQPIQSPKPADGSRAPRRATHELTEQLHTELQKLFDEAQEKAGVSSR
jgi:1-acyl-sn-glycerol-3-phosphate acyltransferase